MTDLLLYMIHMKKPLFIFISVHLKFLKTGGQHLTLHANFQALASLNLLLNVDNFNLEHYKLMKHETCFSLGVLKYKAMPVPLG